MIVEIQDCNEKLTKDDIAKFENIIGYTLPFEYKEFLLKYNGGRILYYELPYYRVNGERTGTLFDSFLNLSKKRSVQHSNIEVVITLLQDSIPNGFIPIGNDAGGNSILLCLKEKCRGKIYFLDHEAETDELNMDHIYFIANNFFEFLISLREVYEEDDD